MSGFLPRTPIILAQGGGQTVLTGSTSQTDLVSVVVPAGSMGKNGILELRCQFTVNNNANNKTGYIIFGAATVAGMNMVSTLGGVFNRIIANSNNAAVQRAFVVNNLVSEGSTTTAVFNGTVDTTVDQTLKLAGLLANGADSLTLEWWRVLLCPMG